MQFGFIGVGLMGGPVCRNLIRGGKSVLVYDLSKDAVERTLAVGTTGKAAAALEDLASCDVLFTSLPLPQHVMGIMCGNKGLYKIMKKGAIHVELSTIDPTTAATLAEEGSQSGVAYIQCTLGKTPAQCEKGEEPMFIGGNQDAIKKLEDVFKIIGIPNYVGTADAACAVKLISNMIGMSNLVILAEGLRLGEKSGMDLNQLLTLLSDTGARSFQMDVRGPWIAQGDFANRFGLDLALKDVRLGCEMARAWGLDLTGIESALAVYKEASASGYGQEDCNAVFKVIK